jgi:hypothetical protein
LTPCPFPNTLSTNIKTTKKAQKTPKKLKNTPKCSKNAQITTKRCAISSHKIKKATDGSLLTPCPFPNTLSTNLPNPPKKAQKSIKKPPKKLKKPPKKLKKPPKCPPNPQNAPKTLK